MASFLILVQATGARAVLVFNLSAGMMLWLVAVLLALHSSLLPSWACGSVAIIKNACQLIVLVWLTLNFYHMYRVTVQAKRPAGVRSWACQGVLAWLLPVALAGAGTALLHHNIGGQLVLAADTSCSAETQLAIICTQTVPTALMLLVAAWLLVRLSGQSDLSLDARDNRIVEKPHLAPSVVFFVLTLSTFVRCGGD